MCCRLVGREWIVGSGGGTAVWLVGNGLWGWVVALPFGSSGMDCRSGGGAVVWFVGNGGGVGMWFGLVVAEGEEAAGGVDDVVGHLLVAGEVVA